ncbi:MAG: bacteriohemerythrin [Oscillospiraceae bacterium]|jgi:hemerythrin|nr:bacteriohemerythrin [Oscillospiraceae bacterium]
MAYTLTPDLLTGNTLIDEEHKQLFKAINDLLEACASGKGRAHLGETLKFLGEYTAKHFGDEEKLQLDSGYPGYSNHKNLHDGFKRVVAELSAKLQQDGATVALVAQVNSNIGDWLVRHIKREDVKVAQHIKSARG